MMNLVGHVVMVIANIVPILSIVGVFTNHVWKGAIHTFNVTGTQAEYIETKARY